MSAAVLMIMWLTENISHKNSDDERLVTVSLGVWLLRKVFYYPYIGQERGIVIESQRKTFDSPGHTPDK